MLARLFLLLKILVSKQAKNVIPKNSHENCLNLVSRFRLKARDWKKILVLVSRIEIGFLSHPVMNHCIRKEEYFYHWLLLLHVNTYSSKESMYFSSKENGCVDQWLRVTRQQFIYRWQRVDRLKGARTENPRQFLQSVNLPRCVQCNLQKICT